MRIWHFKLRNIRRYAAYLGHCSRGTVVYTDEQDEDDEMR